MTTEPSRKQKCREAFDQHGTQAALSRRLELGLAPATLRSWTSEWRRAELRNKKQDLTSISTPRAR
jgi:hypothetical protein